MNRIKTWWKWWRSRGFTASELIIGSGVLLIALTLFLFLLITAIWLIPALLMLGFFGLLTIPSAYWESRRSKPSVRVKRPPGVLLLIVVNFFFSRKTVEEVFKPIIADWLTEY